MVVRGQFGVYRFRESGVNGGEGTVGCVSVL